MTLIDRRSEVKTAKPTRTRELNDVIPLRVAVGVGILWVALVALIYSISPVPTGDPSAMAVTVSVVFELALLGTLAGLVAMRRWGLLASVGAAGAMFVAAAMCSLGGHTGAWLVAQYVAAGTLFTVGRVAYQRF